MGLRLQSPSETERSLMVKPGHPLRGLFENARYFPPFLPFILFSGRGLLAQGLSVWIGWMDIAVREQFFLTEADYEYLYACASTSWRDYCSRWLWDHLLISGWLVVLSIRSAFKADELGLEIAVIALPALLALAADPLASLVDTAFIGHIGNQCKRAYQLWVVCRGSQAEKV